MTTIPIELVVVIAVWVVMVGYGIFERFFHDRALGRIPIRVHVNGTRGKTSTARLIAAGLRAAGHRVCAKTSGSSAAIVDPEGREFPIYRLSEPNVIEQVRVLDRLAKTDPDIVVIECMALQPHLQSLTELKMVRATHGVITNARADHLDVMGPREDDVALALAGTVPLDAHVFTAEREHIDVFRSAAEDRRSAIHEVSPEDVECIDESVLKKFRYSEHPENVALALKVCESLGATRETALEGMFALAPEAGATRVSRLDFFARDIVFVHAFAANDPASTSVIWERMVSRYGEDRTKIAIVNCRIDRPDRSRQLAEVAATWTPADAYVVMGIGTMLFVRKAIAEGVPAHSFTVLENASTEETIEVVLDLAGQRSLVVGVGNIHGGGYEIARFFQNRSTRTDTL